jgi:uncharacterized caspase-like protein
MRFSNPGKSIAAILALALLLVMAPFAGAADRIALVVGNSAYPGAGYLDNPINDARAVSSTLRKLGFEVTQALDLDNAGLQDALETYRDKLASGDTVGFFYFAGHAVQISGNNYLIPVDVDFSDVGQLMSKGYDIRKLLDALSSLSDTMNVIVLDSCRNNPFAAMDTSQLSRGLKLYSQATDTQSATPEETSTSRMSRDAGLGRMDGPINTLIAYSTKPGFVALDGSGRNSPYTSALVKMMQQEGVPIAQVFADVRRLVYEQTGGRQMPWESSSLTQSFVFKERNKAYATPF